MMAKTLVEKIWQDHVVDISGDPVKQKEIGDKDLLYIDLHLIHEVTSPQAFDGLRMNERTVRCPERTFATMDHNVPTKDRDKPVSDPISAKQMEVLSRNGRNLAATLYDLKSENQGLSM